jgi:hypothetical protein
MLSIFTAALHLGLVVWAGEGLFLTSKLRMRTVGGIVQLHPFVSLETMGHDLSYSPWDDSEEAPA